MLLKKTNPPPKKKTPGQNKTKEITFLGGALLYPSTSWGVQHAQTILKQSNHEQDKALLILLGVYFGSTGSRSLSRAHTKNLFQDNYPKI